MGSGHFLTRTTLYLADEINKRVREADELAGQAIAEENGGSNGETHTDGGSVTGTDTGDVSIEKFTEIQLRRDIAKECIFGVDRNSVAVELAKLSLWLETLAAEQPLAFLDHHLKQGDSLLGSDIEEIEGLEGTGRDEEQTTLAPIDRLEKVIEKLVDVFNDLVAIPNETLDDAREMKRIYYEEIQEDTLYRRFHQLANVDLSDSLGLDWAQESAFDRSGIQADAYQYMAGNLESDEHWEGEKIDETVTSKPWFKSAQAQAEQLSFFHWKLEFPEVYYGVGVDDSSKAGFDAIVGNPPWLGTRTGGIPDDVSDFFKRQYGMSGQSDLAEGFLNRCLQLGGQDCSVGMVVPKNIASNEEFEDLRKNITADETLNYAIDFGVAFGGVNTDAMVLGINADPGATSVIVGECSGEAQLETRPVKLDLINAMPFHIFPVNSRNEDIELVKKINEKKTGTLGEEVSISRGLEIGMNDSSISSTKSNNSLALVDHRDVHKYAIDYSGHYLDLDEIDDGDLKDTDLFTTTPKILIRYLNSDIVAGRDDVGYASTNLVHHVQVNGYLDYLMAQVDSALISFWYKHAFQSEEVKFPKVQKSHIESLPIVLPDSGQESDINNRLLGETDDRKVPTPVPETISDSSEPPWVAVRSDIEDRVATIINKKESRFDLDIELNDYIPMDAGTVKLGDLGVLNQTIAGDSVIRDTAVDYRDEKLQIDDIFTSVEGDTLTVSASVRYKPMDTNEFEITNGYVEEDTEEVFKIHDLETEQAEFTAAFISMINENHNDVRGFYKNARKNISLLDRLTEYLLVPEYSQWESEWNRYLKARDYHDRLEKEIHENGSVIDTYFAILFELNQSEIDYITN